MNFFQQQDNARKNTRWLVVLFILAVLSLIALTNLFLFVFPWEWNTTAFSEQGANRDLICLMDDNCSFLQQLDWQRMLYISCLITAVIGLVSLFKWMQIRQGGRAVAQMLGGSEVLANTDDFAEKRLLNVVEEMALAANMPVPAVFILQKEQGINAFAAGFTSHDAVVAVTRGALDSFNRDQLQGVIAHEFSHILNGDMRLNMKLIAILHGIMFITEAGFAFLRTGRHSRRKNEGPVVLLGLGLLLLGSLGTLFGNMIKAAVNRQREFLADASAVQFTRNPTGIADALKIIGGSTYGSQIVDAHSTEVSHLFFGAALSKMAGLFATHPPLVQRIKRIEPYWNGQYLTPAAKPAQNVSEINPNNIEAQRILQARRVADSVLSVSVATAAPVGDSWDPKAMMLDKLHQPLTAAAVLVCLLYHKDNDKQQRIVDELQPSWPDLFKAIQSVYWMNWVREDFLPLVNLATSGLRQLSASQYRDYKRVIMQLMQADGGIDLYEWALFQMLRNSLDSHFESAQFKREKYRKIEEIADEVILVIGTVAAAGAGTQEHKKNVFYAACASCGLEGTSWEKVSQSPIAEFSLAINKIALAYPLLKPRILKALVQVIKADGKIDIIERQTIMAIGAAIDAPLPEHLLAELEQSNK